AAVRVFGDRGGGLRKAGERDALELVAVVERNPVKLITLAREIRARLRLRSADELDVAHGKRVDIAVAEKRQRFVAKRADRVGIADDVAVAKRQLRELLKNFAGTFAEGQAE